MVLHVSADALSRSVCTELLGEAGLGRIAITEGALPLVLPVQYQLVDDQIMFCCGSSLGQSREPITGVIAFESGGVDSSFTPWTVQARGLASPCQGDPSTAMEHCVLRRSTMKAPVFSTLDPHDMFGYHYDVCGDVRPT